jgi:tight adherence protein B
MMVRKRIKLQQKVKALTGEGRMQAAVLIVLPVLAFASLLVVSPQYAATLLQRPSLLVLAAVAQLAGAIWIRRIANFEF